ncbi:GNAT family N-acetyltransferase [Hymenobacter coccineus]|uniref:GNAT family N-acetyltransferase n=1 Tax=Hymenobacter coccineus TaxID=1908235 RepID=A0A1G1TEQ7_9BACT|nr:GNAT family N-acetyltransferase [Hymenobacter coccineus]OGX89335.1 GNAT family N-acetyltransferase [Hymenobacter coccineus]
MLRLVRTDSDNPDFQALVALLDCYLAEIDGDEHAFYAQLNRVDYLETVVVAYLGDAPVGCGAFRAYTAEAVEIKRMFVQPAHRGQGVAGAVLAELEVWALDASYATAVLETGQRQPAAIRLYEKSGYVRTENFGQYAGVVNSVCLRKALGQP